MARTTPVNAGYTIINGTATGSNGYRIDVWAEYKLGNQSLSGNYTPVTVYFYAALNPGYTSSTALDRGLDSALKVNGTAGTGVSNGAYSFESASKINVLGSFSGKIAHNADGTKTMSIQGSFTTESAYISGGSLSASVVLPTIPRASTLGATDADIGKTSVIAVSVKSTGYTHSIAYSFGSLSGYITAAGQTTSTETKFSATSIPFAIPESFYAQIPNAKTGICKLTCKTYSGTTQIGDAQTATFTVTAAESACKPVVTGTVVDVNGTTLALTGNNQKLVKYYSTARCTIAVQTKGSATVSKKTVAGKVISGTSLDIAKVETADLTFQATDSRGYVGTDKDDGVSLVGYIPLSNLASVERDGPTTGNAIITLSGSYFNGSFGAVSNSLTVSYRLNGGSWIKASPNLSFSNGKYSGTISLTGLDYTKSFNLDVNVADKLCSITKNLCIHKGMPVFDWGEEDFVFHVPVELPQLMINGQTLEAYIKTVAQGL